MHVQTHTHDMDTKPENWTGTYEDQVELFVEILAYLLAERLWMKITSACQNQVL